MSLRTRTCIYERERESDKKKRQVRMWNKGGSELHPAAQNRHPEPLLGKAREEAAANDKSRSQVHINKKRREGKREREREK
jgi:hypothetical protein